jgi:LysM repeat protein
MPSQKAECSRLGLPRCPGLVGGNAKQIARASPRGCAKLGARLRAMNSMPNLRRLTRWLGRGLALVALVAATGARAQERTYVVQRSDTLYSIARQFGMSPGRLADRNQLSRNAQVHVGQRLIIPDTPAAAAATGAARAAEALPASVQRAVDQAPVSPRRWKYIVLHHSGTEEGTLKSLDRYHREQRHMENGLAYHFLIGNGRGMGDGEIAVGNRWREQLDGGHLRSEEQNKIALGICLIGNFDKTRPTEKQLRSLETLVRALLKRCQLSAGAVRTHQQINVTRTECPGRQFPTRTFLARLKATGR